MDDKLKQQIHKSRKLLQNPYAYLNGEGEFDAIEQSPVQDVHAARFNLQNPYAYLDDKGGFSGYDDTQTVSDAVPAIDVGKLLGEIKKGSRLSRQDIEAVTRRLQIELWRGRSEIFAGRKSVGPLDVLDPGVALESIGYTVEMAESLGQYPVDGEIFEVAGIVDNSSSRVQLSRRFSPEKRNFTAAHELGHALLHNEAGLHRDRALDGASGSRSREPIEVEADVFATYFLMPEKQVRIAFEQLFQTQRFSLNEATAFALASGSLESLQIKCRTPRDLTRILASAEQYNGRNFHSLARQFCVSIEAMAIRIEELGLTGQ